MPRPHLALSLLVLALAACGDPAVGLDGTRLDGVPYFRATIGGEPWAAAAGFLAGDSYGRGAVQLPDGVLQLMLRGGDSSGVRGSREVMLQVSRATLGVPVPIDGTTAFMAVTRYLPWSADTGRVELVSGGVDTVGSVTLTAYDPIRRRLAGSFAFSAPLTLRVFTRDTAITVFSDSIVTIADGAFLVDLEP